MDWSADDYIMDHEHSVAFREEKPVRATHASLQGSIALEFCVCGALRSVILQGGEAVTSDWEMPEDEEEALYWDGTIDNDNNEEA